ncbi:Deoxyguanosinetriphosphate triphosphohydrolase [Rosistilla carotiformis]|uniref:Deoxyguanosinetriphosphate triphosphohydrolase n=1 Tax=Rosistilla carotiformis TaxID=2528017 RepID=A0A518JNQ8_9BACT|nr:dNTP triphosphohydrolase [Rosistilla carotiformis]QDV67151.1 Deoxyguanosinetriphosphate triphosphohydrolase [Rosistilla carotiformis]
MANTFYNAFDIEPLSGAGGQRPDDYRTPFQIDRDRILYTSAFRRLQSKTQVFLSGEYDFYRTRLTHSLEVAQIGRSICGRLKATNDSMGDDHFIDPDLVEAACLSHDIGHPPFGHAGERVLHDLMRDHGGFEGNAQTLRLLTETIYGTRGMNPSRGFLDATLKYKTLLAETPHADNHFVYDSQQRFLAFAFGNDRFLSQLAPGQERNGFKSVECQIMDWADDTAYSLNDIVDGNNAGFINLEQLERWAETNDITDQDGQHIKDLCSAIRRRRLEPLMGRKVGDFIAAADIVAATDNFMSAHTARYRYDVTVAPEAAAESRLYKRIALDLVFRAPQLQQLDHKAARVLGELYKIFADNYLGGRKRPLRLLPPETEMALREADGDQRTAARILCDTLAQMTDRFAVRTYRRLIDPEFGSIVDLI